MGVFDTRVQGPRIRVTRGAGPGKLGPGRLGPGRLGSGAWGLGRGTLGPTGLGAGGWGRRPLPSAPPLDQREDSESRCSPSFPAVPAADTSHLTPRRTRSRLFTPRSRTDRAHSHPLRLEKQDALFGCEPINHVGRVLILYKLVAMKSQNDLSRPLVKKAIVSFDRNPFVR